MQTFIPCQLVIIKNLKSPRPHLFHCLIKSLCIRGRNQSFSWDKTAGIFKILHVCSVYTAFEKRLSLNTEIIIPSSVGGNNCLKSCFSAAMSYDQIRQTNPTHDYPWISDLTWADRVQGSCI